MEKQNESEPKKRIKSAIEIAVKYGGIDGDHHKSWVIDHMVRALAGDEYDEVVRLAKNGEESQPHDDIADTLADGIQFALIDKTIYNTAQTPMNGKLELARDCSSRKIKLLRKSEMRADVLLFEDGRVVSIFHGICGDEEMRFIQANPDINEYQKLSYCLMKLITGSDLIPDTEPYVKGSSLAKEIDNGKGVLTVLSEDIAFVSLESKALCFYDDIERFVFKYDTVKNLEELIKNKKITEKNKEDHILFSLIKERIIGFCHDNKEFSKEMGLYDHFVGKFEVRVHDSKIQVSKDTVDQINKLKRKYNDYPNFN